MSKDTKAGAKSKKVETTYSVTWANSLHPT